MLRDTFKGRDLFAQFPGISFYEGLDHHRDVFFPLLKCIEKHWERIRLILIKALCLDVFIPGICKA